MMPKFNGPALASLLFSLSLAALPARTGAAPSADANPENAPRAHAQPVPEAIALLGKSGFRLVRPGTLTIGILSGYAPFAVRGPDNRTLVGCDPDLSQLIADSLGLPLQLVDVAWADWPLAVQSGRFDAVFANVTVTEARKKRFDFSTYRNDLLGFYVRANGPIKSISSARDIAGLKIAVGPSTNQEQILLRWNKQNAAAGIKPADLVYYDDDAVRRLALQSGRIDAYFGPNAFGAYEAARDHSSRLAGMVPGGWPLTAEVSVVTRRGSGLAEVVTLVLNTQIRNGNYGKVLAKWSLSSEALATSRTNPPGLPEQ